jgi:hypothetical protein
VLDVFLFHWRGSTWNLVLHSTLRTDGFLLFSLRFYSNLIPYLCAGSDLVFCFPSGMVLRLFRGVRGLRWMSMCSCTVIKNIMTPGAKFALHVVGIQCRLVDL